MVRLAGFEPATYGLRVYIIQECIRGQQLQAEIKKAMDAGVFVFYFPDATKVYLPNTLKTGVIKVFILIVDTYSK